MYTVRRMFEYQTLLFFGPMSGKLRGVVHRPFLDDEFLANTSGDQISRSDLVSRTVGPISYHKRKEILLMTLYRLHVLAFSY